MNTQPAAAADSESLTVLADSLASTFPCCEDAPLALALLRELAKGAPVSPSQLAAVVGRDVNEVTATVARWPNVPLAAEGRVVAFGGLSLVPSAHVFEVAGRQLYTWCAWDTLFLPALLNASARVSSTCPATDVPVRLEVGPTGVTSAEPEELFVSFPPIETTSTSDITATFCCHVHFLGGEQAAREWAAARPGTRTLGLDDAVELGRLATRGLLDG